MNRATLDLWVGIFVAIGLGALLFLGLKVGNLTFASAGETYQLHAKFDNIGGLKVRAPVKSAGVVVGRVSEISFDPVAYAALVTMQIDKRYKFPRDTFATINTSGLLGEQYISFEVGGDSVMLKDGDFIKKTQSAVVLEKLISQFLFNSGNKAAADDGSAKK
ncbi:putative phospholipid ABC transporter-binding protein MlaD [mine drainage metagenome]|uniref:Putative phospholipid ABC transporter-binding protein MlaD n=1 Tax=mine drainage metagenome TaxID=410659 RepID=A0A1J5SJ02_9ZZZZ